MGKHYRKWLALLMVLTLVLSSVGVIPAREAKAATNDTFTLYYYTELGTGFDALYMSIWSHAGLTYGDGVTTNYDFGWSNNAQAELTAVEDNTNWYAVDLKIVADAYDGFDLYQVTKSAVTSDNKLATYDNQYGNNSEIYATLVSGESTAYAIKEGTVYTDLTQAGLTLPDATEPPVDEVPIASISAIMADVPEDYKTMGFTADSVSAMETALSNAQNVVDAESSTVEERSGVYEALQKALDSLVFDADLFVTQIENYSEEDSIRGVDVSSYLSIMDAFDTLKEKKEEAGASQEEIDKIGFKDWDGNVLDKQGFFDLLAESGVNSVRIRVWNNPYNSTTGAGYGGGNNDMDKAVEMGQYITKAGMDTLIDFHFSDFWADPGKQKTPKAWTDYTVEQKAGAIETFVTDSLTELKENDVKVSMVQIGNETNGKFCGEDDFANMNILFDAGCDAVKAIDENILTVIHFTNPETEGKLTGYAASLADYDGDDDSVKEGVSYDVFATSYYPYWHGDIANLKSVLSSVAKTYDKYVLVAETSWANTWKDGDGHENTIMEKSDLGTYVDYQVTLQGQANAVRNVANAMNDISKSVTLKNGEKAGLGFYYWEPAWIPVESLYDSEGELKENAEEIKTSNQEIWESAGCGWAAEAASEYDPDDAGMWHGGSAVDNQAVFDFDGNPLSTLNVFKYFRYGAQASEIVVDGYANVYAEVEVGQTVDDLLPETIQVVYNEVVNGVPTTGETLVTWSQEDIAAVNKAAESNEGLGFYTISGVLEEKNNYVVSCPVEVLPVNLLADGSFENEESAWMISGDGAGITWDDPRQGQKSLHFYYDTDFTFTVETTMQAIKAGYYNASIYMQGLASAGSREGESLYLKATTGDGKEYVSSNVTLGAWLNWQKPMVENVYVSDEMIEKGQDVITLTIVGSFKAGAWGTMDCASLYFNKEEVEENNPSTESPSPSPEGGENTEPTVSPSITPSNEPSAEPSSEPDAQPTVAPSQAPSVAPSEAPAAQPEDESEDSAKEPEQVKGLKVKASGKTLKISWKKTADAKGYEIAYSTGKKFKKASTKKITIKKQKTISKTVKKLKKGKTYYVKVRAYRVADGKKIYGKWSKVVSAKIKK